MLKGECLNDNITTWNKGFDGRGDLKILGVDDLNVEAFKICMTTNFVF